jgi:hypothetical protein
METGCGATIFREAVVSAGRWVDLEQSYFIRTENYLLDALRKDFGEFLNDRFRIRRNHY